jgi:hypothetical protein
MTQGHWGEHMIKTGLTTALLTVLLVAQHSAAASEAWDMGVSGNSTIGETGAIVVFPDFGPISTNAAGAQLGPFRRVIGPGDNLPGTIGTIYRVSQSELLPNTNILASACCLASTSPSQLIGFGMFSIAPSGSVQVLVDGLNSRPGTPGTLLSANAASVAYPFAAFPALIYSSANPQLLLGDAVYAVDLRQTGDRPPLTEVFEQEWSGPPFGYIQDVSINNTGTVAYLQTVIDHNPDGSTPQYDQIVFKPLGGPSTTVAIQGNPAPNGRTYLSMSHPRVNSAGALAFGSFVSGPDINGYGLGLYLRSATGAISEVISPLQVVPGHPREVFTGLQEMRLLPDGTVIFAAYYDWTQNVTGIYRARPPYTSLEVIFDAADLSLPDGQSLFWTSYGGVPCTYAQAESDPSTCTLLGAVYFSALGQFANDSGAVTFSVDTFYAGTHVFASSVAAAGTSSGSAVPVTSTVSLPDGSLPTTVQMNFQSVQAAGTTTVTAVNPQNSGSVQPPAGFEFGTPAAYYNVRTTASFSGSVTLCFTWTAGQFYDPSTIQLLHYENGAWQNVTTSLDTANSKVCGMVTSLSPFAVAGKPFTFTGFFSPIANPPTQNIVKAGSALPIKFSLTGNEGLSIFSTGYPLSQLIACATGTPTDTVTQSVDANASGLQYDPTSNQYTYVWKTDKTWANSCRRLLIKFNTGALRTADFAFK